MKLVSLHAYFTVNKTLNLPAYVCINFKASIKRSTFSLTEVSGYKKGAMKAMEISH
jgi:hypothetical protein